MCQLRKCLYIHHIKLRIADRLSKYHSGVLIYRCLDRLLIRYLHKCRLDPKRLQIVEQIYRSTVEPCAGDYLSASSYYI